MAKALKKDGKNRPNNQRQDNTKKVTQQDRILRYMQTHKGITSMQAFKKFNATRLSSQIFLLRRKGYKINTVTLTGKDGTQYARYELEGATK